MSSFLTHATDLTILLVIGGVLVGVALLVAEVAHHFVFGPRRAEMESESKLLDLVHSSLLAFIAFMLAISVTDVRATFGKADDAVAREGELVAVLDRDVAEQAAAWADPTRAILRRYVETVSGEEWRRLAMAEPRLSKTAQTQLDELRVALRQVPADEATRSVLLTAHDRLERARTERYEYATRSVPQIFWVLIGGFLFGSMVMNGRYRPSLLTRMLVGLHFAAIGMSVGLILILDAPFRGQTSISPAPLVEALQRG